MPYTRDTVTKLCAIRKQRKIWGLIKKYATSANFSTENNKTNRKSEVSFTWTHKLTRLEQCSWPWVNPRTTKLFMCQSFPAASIPPGKPPGIPWAFEKIVQMPGPAGNFCWQMPRPPFLLWWSNARSPSPSDQYTKLLVAIFNKHNCFSSVELYKTGHEMSHSDSKKAKQMVFLLL